MDGVFSYVGHLSAKPVIHDAVAEQLLDKFYTDEKPPNAEGEIVIDETLEGINITGPWQVNIPPSPDNKTRVRYFAYGKADITRLFIGAGKAGDYKNLLLADAALRRLPTWWLAVCDRKRRHAFLGRLLPRRSAITGFERDDNLVFEESEPRFSKIIGLSEFSQKALKLNVFAITDVLIYGENSSFENLHLDISFSKAWKKVLPNFCVSAKSS